MLTEMLPVKLTPDELRERGRDLAKTLRTIDEETASFETVKAGFKSRVKGLQAEVHEFQAAINSGQEDREVQIEEQKDYDKQEVRTLRIDTDEVIRRRAMTPTELQRPLPLGEAREARGKKKGAKAAKGGKGLAIEPADAGDAGAAK